MKRGAQDNRTGQSVIETAVLIIILALAFIAMQVYLKRAMQGRLKGAADQLGEQYDPERTTSDMFMNHVSNSTTTTITEERAYLTSPYYGGQYENRVVTTTSTELHYDNTFRNGFEYVGRP